MGLEIGQVIDEKYRVVRLLGEGGMGAVYEGENVRIRRRVAIKTLHSNIANQEVVTRFEREAQAAGRIGSDHILEVLDLGALPTGDRFIVMEFLDGEPLSGRIKNYGRLTSAQLLPIMRQVLEGLAAAHAAGIVHRDLKPDNIFILRQKARIADFAKIIDFGISKFHNDQQGSVAMTRAGSLMGTPLYMSPEQANGSADADARSDIYSLGMIMYEALAGEPPFSAQNLNELLFKIVLSDVPAIDTVVPGIEPVVAAVVTKAIAKKREDRFGSAAEMLGAVDAARANLNLGGAPYPMPGPGGTWSTPAQARTPPPIGRTPPPGYPQQPLHATTPHPAMSHTPQPGYPSPAQVPLGSTPHGARTPQPLSHPTPGPQINRTPYPTMDAAGYVPPGGTDGAWGHSSQAPRDPPIVKSKAPLFVGLGIGSLVLFLMGGLALSRLTSKTNASSAQSPSAVAAPIGSPSTSAAAETTTVPTPLVPLTDPSGLSAGAPTTSTTTAQTSTVPANTATARAGGGTAASPNHTSSAGPKPRPSGPAPAASKKPDWGY